jgi:hypothetical protein
MVLFIFVTGISIAMAYTWVWWRGYQRVKYLQQAELFWEKAGKETTVGNAVVRRDS